jgi:carbon-monoxide dehydrogenase small subunit
MLAAQAEGKTIETFENIHELKKYSFLKEVFMHYGDIECGYCMPGLVMSTKALLDTINEPTEEEIVDALAGNVCRCTKKPLPVADILEAIKKMRGKW